jgi:hypothetical protein
LVLNCLWHLAYAAASVNDWAERGLGFHGENQKRLYIFAGFDDYPIATAVNDPCKPVEGNRGAVGTEKGVLFGQPAGGPSMHRKEDATCRCNPLKSKKLTAKCRRHPAALE